MTHFQRAYGKEMMIRNTETSWGSAARTLHWLIAVLILGLFAYGLWMNDFPAREDRGYHYAIHAAIGITILALMVLRLVWRFVNPTPVPPPNSANWEITAARLGHFGLYVLVFGVLIVGWLLAGTMKTPVPIRLFGLVPVPTLLETGSPYHRLLGQAHEFLAYAVMTLVAVHAAAAVWHQRVKHDGVLTRMTKGTSTA
jgi:cytochrome b561